MRRAASTALALVWSCIACAGVPTARESIELEAVDGTKVDALAVRGAEVLLLLFLGTECPIARAYSPELAKIAGDYGPRLATRIVLVDADLDPVTARQHAADFSLPSPVLLDPSHRLVRKLGATITPEAFVLLQGGEVAYSGRIDDRFAGLGRPRQAPRTRDLRDAIEALLAGRRPDIARTEAVGCFIE